MVNKDILILRDLAKKTMEAAQMDIQNERREMWSDFNSMKSRRVPVFIFDIWAVAHEVETLTDICEDEVFRYYENAMKINLYHSSAGDDYILEPWVTVRPIYKPFMPNWERYGFKIDLKNKGFSLIHPEPPIKSIDDLDKMVTGMPEIDEIKTKEKTEKIIEAIGDIIPVIPENKRARIGGTSGLSYSLGYLLGYEQLMYQLYDNPEMVHRICEILTKTVEDISEQDEKNGRLTNCDSIFPASWANQAMVYTRDIPAPGIPQKIINRKQRWIYDNCQEFETVSPEMTNEFLLEYLKPFYEKFGLLAYGCCENLTKKIPYLKKIKNLRRIAVTPWADNEECAKQLEDKYVISWRPNPAEMVTNGFDPERIVRIVKNAKSIFDRYGCFWEIQLKDMITIEHDCNRFNKWVDVVRNALEQ